MARFEKTTTKEPAGPRYDVELPYRIRGTSPCKVKILDPALVGSKDHFLRFDLYPLVAPLYLKRHYGWWDIPLKHFRGTETEVDFNPLRGTIRLARRVLPIRIRGRKGGPLQETGYCKLHVSLWEYGRDEPRMLSVHEHLLLLLRGMDDLPLKGFNIPVTDRCNLKCRMCPRQSTDDLVEVDIDPVVLERLIEEAPHVRSILLQGLGEPLLYGRMERLVRRLRSAMPPDGEVGFTTNATLLDRARATAILDAGPDFIYFSVDGATRSTYEATRIGAEFSVVLKNIRDCVELRNSGGNGKPRLMMNFVLMDSNVHEIVAFTRLTADIGVKYITFSRCLDSQSGGLRALDSEALAPKFEEARRIGREHGMNVFLPPLERAEEEKCLFMERAVMLGTGEVLPCHAMAPGYNTNRKLKVFGNVREGSLSEIWNLPETVAFRQRILAGDFPDECSGCGCKAYLVP
jgi:MoaA/NifB/PqqE/SkfB family radical SAM enzyme